jgi:DNA polymerase III subunit epsilon
VIPFLRRRHRSPAARAYARARRRDPGRAWREERYAVLDFETTGLDPRADEIISFASVPIDDGRVIVGGARTALVRPERMPEAETIRIHGLRPIDLAGAPTLASVLDQLLASLTGRVLVAHAAWVELGFLAAALRPLGLRPPDAIVDTGILAGRVLGNVEVGEGRTPRLADLARRLGLPLHSPHTAAGDALTTAQVFLALATRLDAERPQTVGSLAGADRKEFVARRSSRAGG